MMKNWEGVRFYLIAFKKSGTFTCTGFDDAMNLLDEQIIVTSAMQYSPFKGPFVDTITEWNQKLLLVSDTIEQWITCQGQWMYLQPIFDSPDIMKQLPGENKKFKQVDLNWRNIIKKTEENPSILSRCEEPELFAAFKAMNEHLDMVQKGLKDYLESKRAIFA